MQFSGYLRYVLAHAFKKLKKNFRNANKGVRNYYPQNAVRNN